MHKIYTRKKTMQHKCIGILKYNRIKKCVKINGKKQQQQPQHKKVTLQKHQNIKIHTTITTHNNNTIFKMYFQQQAYNTTIRIHKK